jgi:hypothetical protein
MGLDQSAYATKGEQHEDIATWRKHNRLQGWMEANPMGDFNCIPLELTLEDIDSLEYAINNFELPETGGFFFGNDSYFWTDEEGNPYPDNHYYYKDNDLYFIRKARDLLDKGWKVFFDSWW